MATYIQSVKPLYRIQAPKARRSQESTSATSPPTSFRTSPSGFVTIQHMKIPKPFRQSKPKSFRGLMERMTKFEEKRNVSLEKLKKQAEERNEIKPVSPVNHMSRKLTQGQVPIQERFQKIIEERNKRLQELREAVNLSNTQFEAEETRFSPKICPSSRKPMSPTKFYEYTEKWAESTQKKITEFRETLEAAEKVETTFRPIINKSPKGGKTNPPIYERLETCLNDRKRKLEELKRAQTPTFTPKINRKKERTNSLGACLKNEEESREDLGSSLDLLRKIIGETMAPDPISNP